MTIYMGLNGAQLGTLRRTIAKELTDLEFELFMEACRSYKLDPFRKQIIPAVYNKHDDKKRQMTLITTRDGLRVIASRQGNYRPQSEPAVFTYHPADWQHPGDGAPPNPLKIESCTVKLWRKDDGEWFPIIGQVFWDEYAPRGHGWSRSQWPQMPRVMIQKCAEAAALRAGWPDAFAGLYVAEELEGDAQPAQTATEALQIAQTEKRKEMVGRGILFDLDGTRLEKIEAGKVFDAVVDRMSSDWSDQDVLRFAQRNELALRDFWSEAPSDALELKKIMEPRIKAAIQSAEAKLAAKQAT